MIKNIIGISFILMLLIFIGGLKSEGFTQQETNEILYVVENTTMNLSSNFEYHTPYDKEFGAVKFVDNILHGMVYFLTIEINSIIGGILNVGWEHLNYDLVPILLGLVGTIISIWIISKLFVPVIATYILIKDIFEEKKDIKLKWWQTTLITILIWGSIIGFIILVMFNIT